MLQDTEEAAHFWTEGVVCYFCFNLTGVWTSAAKPSPQSLFILHKKKRYF